MNTKILTLSLPNSFGYLQQKLWLALFILLAFVFAQKTNAQCNISCPADVTLSACTDPSLDPNNTGNASVNCDGYTLNFTDSMAGMDASNCAQMITRTWTATPQTCNPVTIAKWDLNECYSNSGDNSGMIYDEFTPMFPNGGNFINVNATGLDRQEGMHSCTYGLNNSLAACFGMDEQSWSDNNSKAIRFDVTLNPDNMGKLTELSFYELAPTQYQWVSDYTNSNNNEVSGANNYPTQYGIRVLKNGVEIFQQINIPTTQQWTLESFDFSGNADFGFTTTTTFSFEILAYNPVGNGSDVFAWDVEDIEVKGCDGLSDEVLTCTQMITLQNDLTASINSSSTSIGCDDGASVELMGSSNMGDAFYAWTGPNNFASNQQNISVNAAGTYTLTVVKECCTVTETIDISADLCEYDLALIKILAEGQSSTIEINETVDFIVKVTNQGQTPSGDYEVMDRIPDGMSFVSAGMGGVHNNGLVTWNLSGLNEGDFIELPITLRADEIGTGRFVNWAEISEDSGDDEDSTPDGNTGFGFTQPNDLVDNHNDMMLDNSPIDEDDNDFEEVFVDRGLQLLTRVYLQGAMSNTDQMVMRDDLRSEDLIPAVEPYSSLEGFEHAGYGGGETTTPEVLEVTGSKAVVDWILLELRESGNPSNVVATCAGLALSDGSVVGPDGVSSLAFPGLDEGYYHVAIRHRNHLGAMLSAPVYLSNTEIAQTDFTTEATYGQHAQSELPTGLRALWAGNANGDGQVIFQGNGSDVNGSFFEVLTDSENGTNSPSFVSNGYLQADFNMDCQGIYQGVNNDLGTIFFNTIGHPGNSAFINNYVVEEQLP